MIAFNEASLLSLHRDVEREADAAFSPRVWLSVADWAEKYRWLPKSTSSEEGPFRNARLPFLRKIQDALSNPRVGRVVLMKGSQVAGTTCAENWIGWTMTENPASMLSVWPTEKLFRRFSRERLEKMIESTPALAMLFAHDGLRDAADSMGHKEYPGGSLNIVTARSASDLRSISVPRVHVSEVDALLQQLSGEGDPIELMRSRGETFWDYKEFLESTPLIFGESRIDEEIRTTTWNEWYMPCPHCNALQCLRWRDGMEDGDYDRVGDYRFIWEKDSADQVIPGSVVYICDKCACTIEERWKEPMLAEGEWIERFPDRRDWGFHLPSFASPLISWQRIAERFERAKRSQVRMQTFVNNICGLPYKEKSRSVTSHFLAQRAETYLFDVPAGVLVIVVGMDVQGDRVEIAIWGFGAGEEMWLLKWIRVEGEPGLDRTWREVGERLRAPLRDHHGRARYVAAGCIDTKYQGEHAHRFCNAFRGHNGARILPIIGKEGRGRPVIEMPAASTRRRSRAKKPARMVGIDTVKDLLADRLLVKEKGPEYVHFPTDLDPAFYDQLTAEELKTVYVKKRPVRRWTKKSADVANEGLDLTVYAYAALVSMGSKILRELAELGAVAQRRKLIAAASATDAPAENAQVAVKTPSKKRSRARVHSPGVL